MKERIVSLFITLIMLVSLVGIIPAMTAVGEIGKSVFTSDIKYQLKENADLTDIRFVLIADEQDVINADNATLYATISELGDTASIIIRRAYRSIVANGNRTVAGEGKVFLIGKIQGLSDDMINGITAHFSLGEKTYDRTIITGNTDINLSKRDIVTKLKRVSQSNSSYSISSGGTISFEYKKRVYIFNISDYEKIHILDNIDSNIAFYNTETPLVDDTISLESVIGVTTLNADTKTEFEVPENALSFGITVTSSNPEISVIGVNKNTYLENIPDLSLLTENLINPELVQEGDYKDYKRTNNIEVEPNTTYVVSRHALLLSAIYPHTNYRGKFLDENLNDIATIDTNPFTTPDNCKYIYLTSASPSVFDNYKLEKGNEFTAYVPYGLKGDYPDYYNSPVRNKKLCAVGDSITAGRVSYVRNLSLKLGMIRLFDVNKSTAISGSTVSKYGNGDTTREDYMCSDARVENIPLNSEIIIIMGGSNDYKATIGTIDDEHTEDTFYGAYQLMLDKTITRCPNAEIFLCEMPYTYISSSYAAERFEQRQQAIRDIAEKYSLPLLSTSDEGVNDSNYTEYRLDTTHPNEAGKEVLATIFANQMIEYYKHTQTEN